MDGTYTVALPSELGLLVRGIFVLRLHHYAMRETEREAAEGGGRRRLAAGLECRFIGDRVATRFFSALRTDRRCRSRDSTQWTGRFIFNSRNKTKYDKIRHVFHLDTQISSKLNNTSSYFNFLHFSPST